jgi:hypothetical protein
MLLDELRLPDWDEDALENAKEPVAVWLPPASFDRLEQL